MCLSSVCAGEVREKGTRGEAQSHDRIRQEVFTRSTSLPAHPRWCQFYEATPDQQRGYIQGIIFRQNTASHPSLSLSLQSIFA